VLRRLFVPRGMHFARGLLPSRAQELRQGSTGKGTIDDAKRQEVEDVEK
jgi:hypothetical protein